MNISDTVNTITRDYAHKIAQYTDSVAYAYMMAQFEALKAKGEDPTEYEVVFATNEFPKQTADGYKIERYIRLVKVEDIANLPVVGLEDE